MCTRRGGSILEARIITVFGENSLLLGAAAECGLMLEIFFEKTAVCMQFVFDSGYLFSDFFLTFAFIIVWSCRTLIFWYLDFALELTKYSRKWLVHTVYETKGVSPYID